MTASIKFPNALLWVEAYLDFWLPRAGFPTARVSQSWRGDPVEVWLGGDGGPVLDVVRKVERVRANCLHDGANTDRANDLAQTVSALLRSGADGDPVQRVVQTGGPSVVPQSTKPHVLLNFELTVRGTPLSLS